MTLLRRTQRNDRLDKCYHNTWCVHYTEENITAGKREGRVIFTTHLSKIDLESNNPTLLGMKYRC